MDLLGRSAAVFPDSLLRQMPRPTQTDHVRLVGRHIHSGLSSSGGSFRGGITNDATIEVPSSKTMMSSDRNGFVSSGLFGLRTNFESIFSPTKIRSAQPVFQQMEHAHKGDKQEVEARSPNTANTFEVKAMNV